MAKKKELEEETEFTKKEDTAPEEAIEYGVREDPIYEVDEKTGLPDPNMMTTEDIIAYNNRVAEKGEGIMLEMPEGRTRPKKRDLGVINKETISKANTILQEYKKGKSNLETKIIANEQWYKMRHWDQVKKTNSDVSPASGWLFNCIANKHADVMDNYPAPNVLPREKDDKAEADMLTSIIPVILEQNDFEETYSNVMYDKIKTGTGVYGVYWDNTKNNGLGDISVTQVDLLNLFFEPGITDIQDSTNVFHVKLIDNDVLVGNYPELEGKIGGKSFAIAEYMYDDTVDTSNKSVVVDWYYKKAVGTKTVLHYVKYVDDNILFATENDEEFCNDGWYDHGKYPFIFDVLFPVKGTPTGFGYIDIGKDAQEYIDRGNQAILENMLVNSKPRYFVRKDGSVNEEEYADLSKSFIHTDGNLGSDSIMPVTNNGLNGLYVTIVNNKIDELKETTGNRDISTGGTTSGVTAASAIAAMQEAGSKLSRDNGKGTYRAFRRLVLMLIELIRQFYDMPRCFRIMGEDGSQRFIEYTNRALATSEQMGINPEEFRAVLFDVEVSAQKQSPYTKMSQNELALQLYSAGMFNPTMSDQALACLDMMDFGRKSFVQEKIAQNRTMFDYIQQLQQQQVAILQMLDNYQGTNLAQQAIAQFGGEGNIAEAMSLSSSFNAKMPESEAEAKITKKARAETAERTNPE